MILNLQNIYFEDKVTTMMRRLARWAIALAIVTAGVLLVSGQWTDPWLWSYVVVWGLLSGYALFSIDEDLARERFHPPEQSADHLSLHFVRVVALAHLLVGALDTGRLHWTSVASGLRAAGLIGMALAGLLVFRAMLSNRFFSAVVRIQKDRGHRVIDSGPYSTVRHPGYAGMILVAPMSGLALGSWISVGLALIYSGLILRRVLFEDAFLRRNLDGYDAYAQRVPYRLVPGVF
jgi:protein-S-isoprenylcysteine O-methyltransferase Ste14